MSGFKIRHPEETKSGFAVRQPECPECGVKGNELVSGPFESRIPAIAVDGDKLSCLHCGHEWERSR